MSGLELSEELEELRRTVEAFAHDVVAPVIGDYYERHEFPYDLVAEMGRMGLFGLPFPEEYGGMGGDLTALCVAIEELARVDSSVAITLEAGVGLGANPLHKFGSEEQKREWLPRLCRGEVLGGFGLTEPGGGSDAGATRTTARLDGEHWVINGSKSFITNSGTDITGFVIVTAVTGEKPAGGKEISAILVPSGTPGFTVAPAYSKVGWNASDTRELFFDDVRVGPDASRRRTWSGSVAGGTRSSCRSSTRDASRSRRSRRGSRRDVSTSRSGTPSSERRSGHRSARTRVCRSSSPTWRYARTARGCSGGTRRAGWRRAGRTSGPRRSPSSIPPRPRWTTPGTPPRSMAGTAS